MSKILIIGNVLKDVYLKLDGRLSDFETDAHGINWLNLGFNGSSHAFFHRTSVYGGAAVSLSVLTRLGLDAKILDFETDVKNGDIIWRDDPSDYRYIFCTDGEITYFIPSGRQNTSWSTPSGSPEWILVDRSALVTPSLVEEIKNFLKFSPSTKLAVHAGKHLSPAAKSLTHIANLLFLEDEPPVHTPEKIQDIIEHPTSLDQLVCHISPHHIVLDAARETWQLSRTDMFTHLTVYSTIVATVLGVIAAGGTAADAVLWARLNAEQATLESSLSARRLKELASAELEKRQNLRLTARTLFDRKKGILAADESDSKLTERLVHFGIPATAASRSAYRELLITTPELRSYASAVILTPTVAQSKLTTGQTYLDYLTARGIITGLKADLGQAPLAPLSSNSAPVETYTLGSDDLAARLRSYYPLGIRFVKWRAAFTIDHNLPSFVAVEKNCDLAASFAKESQLAGLVPLVEIDVSSRGDFSIEQSIEAQNRILTTLFTKLAEYRVELQSCLLKTNMVMAGLDSVAPSSPQDVGLATSAILKHCIPRRFGGVFFLSGGQDAKTATRNLTTICENGPYPYPVSFAFSRALQDPVMQTWKGKSTNTKSAQAALLRHLEENSHALK